jgi:hypothetical protein
MLGLKIIYPFFVPLLVETESNSKSSWDTKWGRCHTGAVRGQTVPGTNDNACSLSLPAQHASLTFKKIFTARK